jgi:quinoprotein glucose dehydrogenase
MAPPSLDGAADGTRGTLSLPSFNGGANWWGGAYDPATGLLYVGSMTIPSMLSLAAKPPGSDIRYQEADQRAPRIQGLPLIKPPWGRITAIDLKSGQPAWMIANADTPKDVANHPALKGLTLPRTGIASQAGLLVTKTLLFAGEGERGSPILRAHDKATGAILAAIPLPGTQIGLPMTYVWKGRQCFWPTWCGSLADLRKQKLTDRSCCWKPVVMAAYSLAVAGSGGVGRSLVGLN